MTFQSSKQRVSGADLVRKMCSAIIHRGPDDEAYFSNTNVQLGMTRLAILDLRKRLYPLRNENGQLFLFYNGEIYNFTELTEELTAGGHKFTSMTDAEVVVHGYEEWGPDCLRRFNGMWAFALWDASKERLFLARDHFGIKPLYYCVCGDFMAFASEIRALLSLSFVKKSPNEKVVYEYLVHGRVDHGEETFFDGINRLMPGHYATVSPSGSFRVTQYWRMPRICEDASREDMREASDEVRRLLIDAIRRRLVSDVPVGVCLSGGLDSSSIVSVISRLEETAKKSLGERLQAFSAWYKDSSLDESHFAKIVTNARTTEINAVYPSASGLWRDLQELVCTQEEPFVSTSMYAQWKIMQAAKAKGVKVLLDGQGGDEVFAGYVEYFKFLVFDLLKRNRVIAALRESLLSLDLTWRLIPLLFTVSSRADQIRREFLNAGFAAEFDTSRRPLRIDPNWSLAEVLWNDTTRFVLPSLLRYEDKNSMHFSIESRLPFLDQRLVEYVASLPLDFKIRDGWTKRILREAMRGIVPPEITSRRSKIGFETPQQRWLFGELGSEIEHLLSSSMRSSRYVNQAAVRRLFTAARGKRRVSRWDCEFIWRCLSLELWLRQFIPSDLEDDCS